MKATNLYKAFAAHDLVLNDTVVIDDGVCRLATHGDLNSGAVLFSVIQNTKAGEEATLSGPDTVLHITENHFEKDTEVGLLLKLSE